MIQEPMNDLDFPEILGEPVEEVTAEYPAMPDPARTISRDDQYGYARQASSLRSRLTVKLVALDSNPGFVSAHDTDPARDTVHHSAYNSLHDAPTLELTTLKAPAHVVPTRVLVPEPDAENGRAAAAPALSVPFTPEPEPNVTPAPEENEYNEYLEDGDADGPFYPYVDLPTPEPDANRVPYTPTPDSDVPRGPYTPAPEDSGWLYQESTRTHTSRLSHRDIVQPIILPMKSEIIEAVTMDLTPIQPYKPERSFRLDPMLAMLTFLLLLGILGGIGFGYLLTIVYQG